MSLGAFMEAQVNITDKLALSINEACEASGFGRTTIYEAIENRTLVARKLGKRTLILRADLEAWLQALPTFEPEAECQKMVTPEAPE